MNSYYSYKEKSSIKTLRAQTETAATPFGESMQDATSRTVLEKHADDCHHGQAAVGQLGRQFAFAGLRVLDLAQEVGEADAVVARLCRLRGVLHGELTLARPTAIRGGGCLEEAGGLDEAAEGNDLCSSKNRNPQTTLHLQSLHCKTSENKRGR